MWKRIAIDTTLATAGASVLGLLGDAWWICDLFAHFRLHYLLGALPATAYLLYQRNWRWGTAAFMTVVLNAGLLAALYSPFAASTVKQEPVEHETHAAAGPERALRVLLLNVNQTNETFGAVASLIRRSQADVVALVEVNERWLLRLQPALEAYPHRAVAAREDMFGVAIYSRRTITSHRVVAQLDMGFPTLYAVVEVSGARVAFALLHLPPPLSAAWARAGMRHVGQLTALREGRAERLVLLGDFNATPWGRVIRRLRLAGFRRAGVGQFASWPSALGVVGIPIDHLLLSGAIDATAVEVGQDVGSDHRPLLATLIF